MAKTLLQHDAGSAAEASAVEIRNNRSENGLSPLLRQDAREYHSGDYRNNDGEVRKGINHQSDECRPRIILILTKVSFNQIQ
ncbi:hypothetical protein AAII07_49810 [Microvirga sp. 0TCS3.31]